MCWLCNLRSMQFADEDAGDAIGSSVDETAAELAAADAEPPPVEAGDVRNGSE